jgi:hypothetical protein
VRVGTWDELKLACENPTQFHLQLPPENIEIECVSYETAWIPDGNGTIGRDCTHKVIARLRSTKIDVSAEEFIFPGTVTSFDCPRFKEVLRVYRKPLQITCEEALTCPQTNLGDICESAVREDINANPELVSETDTGRTLDTCQAANPSVCK